MSKQETDLPARLRAVGATDLERRLLEAAGREQPSPDLSARMAQAIGVSMVSGGSAATESVKTGTAAAKAANASSSLVPWVSGALLAVGVLAGAFVATRPGARPSAPSAVGVASLVAPGASSEVVAVVAAPLEATPASDARPDASAEAPARAAPPSPRGRRGTTSGELANQIALVDAARRALAAGAAERALAIVRDYQSEYPTGTFRPEVSAVKVEALVKLGRITEARTLAERFVVAYGPGPLADRVARLAHIAQP